MVLVVGFAALVTVAAAAYLALNSPAMPMAMNNRAAVRAQHMAGSGIAMATHFLAVPPTTVTVGNYWTGTSGAVIDASSDTVDVTVTRSNTAQENYGVTATGYARNADGSIRGKSIITTEIITPPPYTWTLTRTLTASGAITIPDKMTFSGSLHANGNLTCGSDVSGSLTSTGTVTYTGTGSPTLTQNATAAVLPALNLTDWNRYVVHGVVRAATPYTQNDLTGANVAAAGGSTSMTVCINNDGSLTVVDTSGSQRLLGSLVSSVTSATGLTGTLLSAPSVISNNNPGGVLVCSGNIDLPSGSTGLIGTLVVNGNLTVKSGATPTFCAMPGYPALVVSGKISIDNSSTTEIYGSVLCGDRFEGNKPKLLCKGPVLAYGTAFASNFGNGLGVAEALLGIRTQFSWMSTFQNYYDFSNTSVRPMTLLSWNE